MDDVFKKEKKKEKKEGFFFSRMQLKLISSF